MSVRVAQRLRPVAPGPVHRVDALAYQAMECGIGPIRHPLHQTVLHRVDVYVVHMCPVIGFVFNQMFPEATLPEAPFPAPPAHCGEPFRPWKGFGETGFDQAQPQGEIGVALRQPDHAMQVIRQHHPAVDVEPVGAAYRPDRFTQLLDMPGQEIVAVTPQQSEREEVGAARVPGASVIGHGTMISSPCIRRNTLRYCALRGLLDMPDQETIAATPQEIGREEISTSGAIRCAIAPYVVGWPTNPQVDRLRRACHGPARLE